MERRKIGAISSLKKGPDFSEPNAKNIGVLVQIFDLATAPISKRPKSTIWLTLTIRCVSGDSECRKIIETKPKKWIQRVLLWFYAPARSFAVESEFSIRYTTPVRKRPKSLIWLTLTARGPGESKPPDGFWFYCTGAKEQFCQSKLYAKKQLRNLWLKFLFIPLKLKTEFLHNLTVLNWAQ